MAHRTQDTTGNRVVTWLGRIVAGVVALSGSVIAWSALLVNHRKPLPPALTAPRRQWTKPSTGTVSYYVDHRERGRPLVLIHSINAGACAYEMRPLFEYYRTQRPVYAPDLPGFGTSERSDRAYTPELYTQSIIDLIDGEVERDGPVDLVAFSLSSEFAARAAKQRPDLIRSLTLISPTGFNPPESQQRLLKLQQSGTSDRLLRFLRFPLWSQAFYDLLVVRPSLRYFLQILFVGEVDQSWVDYAYLTTHQPNARFAPFFFVSGKLFSPNIRETVYEQIDLPVLVLYDRDPNVRFDTLPDVIARKPNWHAQRIVPTLGVPHWEKLRETTEAIEQFWQIAETPIEVERSVR